MKLGAINLKDRLGQGAMGDVWYGVHERSGEPVAVKVIRRELCHVSTLLEAFEREVRATARLDHPGIVEIFDYGVIEEAVGADSETALVEGTPWFAMEYASNGNLNGVMQLMNWSTVKAVLISLLDALAHAHARGLVHRDIKPANILLDADDGLIRVLLSDFGLAHAVERMGAGELSDKEERSGTPFYMAPEQVRGQWRDFGPWTDLYALGCLAYELACGRPPFEARNTTGLWLKHLDEPPPPLDPQIAVPDGFDRWIERLLAKEPTRRFQCAADAAWNLRLVGDVAGERDRVAASNHTVSIEQAETLHHLSVRQAGGLEPQAADTRVDRGDDVRILAQTAVALESLWTSGAEQTGLWSESSVSELAPQHGSAYQIAHRKRIDPRGLSLAGYVRALEYEMPAFASEWHRDDGSASSPSRSHGSLGLLGLRQPPLVGREAEARLLWRELGEVFRQRTTRTVVVRARPGLGKGRLMQWFMQRAQEVGAAKVFRIPEREASGAGDELRLALCDYLRTWGLSRRECRRRVGAYIDRRLDSDDAELAELLEQVDVPALTQLMAPASAGPQRGEPEFQFAEPTQKWSVITRFLSLEAAHRPLIVWIDGATARSETLDLVRCLKHQDNLAEMGCLVVISTDDEQMPSGARRRSRLEALLEEDEVVGVQLEALPEAEQRAVINGLSNIHPQLVAALQRQSRGSVLFAIHLFNHLVEIDALEASERGYRLKADPEQVFPKDGDALWKARLDQSLRRLPVNESEDVWAALEAAAALGQSIDRDEWQQLVDHLGLTVHGRLWDELSRQGLASATPTGWRIGQETLRQMLERHSKRAGRWEAINQAVARILSSHPLSATTLRRRALHLRRAGQLEAALEPLREAGRELMGQASFEQASACLSHYRQIVERADLPPDDLRRSADLAMQADIARIIGRPEEVRHWSAAFIREAAQVDEPAGLASVMHTLAEMARLDGNVELGAYFYRHACSTCEKIYDIAGQVRALSGEGWLRGLAGQLDRAEELLEEAIDTGRQFLSRQVRGELSWCHQGLAEIAWFRGDFDRATAQRRQAEKLARAVGAPVYIGMAHRLAADLAWERGDSKAAWRKYRNALDMLVAINSRLADLTRVGAAVAAMEEGQFGAAEDLLVPLEAVAIQEGRSVYRLLFGVARLALLAHQRDLDAWDGQYEKVCAMMEEVAFVFPYIPCSAELAARILEDAGHPERAEFAKQLARRQWLELSRS